MKSILALALVALALAGCCAPAADPYMKVRSPVWFNADPVLQPSQYVQVAPAQVQYVPVPVAAPVQAAPAAAPCFPSGAAPYVP